MWMQRLNSSSQKNEREARSIIPVLPLIMYKKLGAQSAEWFTKNALDCLSTYSISEDGNTITTPTDNIFNKLFENWNPDFENAECNLNADGNTIKIGSFDILSFNEKVKKKLSIQIHCWFPTTRTSTVNLLLMKSR